MRSYEQRLLGEGNDHAKALGGEVLGYLRKSKEVSVTRAERIKEWKLKMQQRPHQCGPHSIHGGLI